MKSLRQLVAIVAIFVSAVSVANATRQSQQFFLDRFTVLANGSLKHDTGNLLDTGQFRVLLSEIVDPFWYSSLEDYLPVSGRPLFREQMFGAYHALGIIPGWRRSRDVFDLDLDHYVIVSTAGVDPNPVPVITEQPNIERVLVGDSASFFVYATPVGSLSYQWRFKGIPLRDHTDSLLILDNVRPAQAGLYSVALNAGGKSVVSKPALLQVIKPVAVTNPLRSQTVHAGKPVVFRVAVSGTGPFKYQWYHNFELIPNATKSFYSIPKVQPKDAGNYWVDVDNDLSVTYSDAFLTTIP